MSASFALFLVVVSTLYCVYQTVALWRAHDRAFVFLFGILAVVGVLLLFDVVSGAL